MENEKKCRNERFTSENSGKTCVPHFSTELFQVAHLLNGLKKFFASFTSLENCWSPVECMQNDVGTSDELWYGLAKSNVARNY